MLNEVDAANTGRETRFSEESIHPSVGAMIEGFDVTTASEEDIDHIRNLFDQHGALLFRGQKLDPAGLIRFSRLLGDLDEVPVNEGGKTAVEGFPELYVISNIAGEDGKPVGSLGAGEASWHTDMSYLACPPRASILYAVEIPPVGGNTSLAGMRAALQQMPADLRQRIEGRRIKHDGTYNSGGFVRKGLQASDDPMTSVGTYHPAICKHPGTGEEVLFLGRRRNAYVEDLSLEESEALLDDLWAHATSQQFAYTHEWKIGDLLMWDNRASLHRRDAFDGSARRYMLRTQIKGVECPQASF